MNPAGCVYPVKSIFALIAMLLATCGLVLAGGCFAGTGENAGHGPEGAAHQPLSTVNPSNPPSVLIIYPDFDGGVDAGNVTVSVSIRNFMTPVQAGGHTPPGEGKIAYFMDVVPPTAPGVSAATPPGTFHITAQHWYTWHNVTEGTHTFAVELVNGDGTPLVPPVIDAVDVTAVRRPGT